MRNSFLLLGAICAFIAVAMGAFGAHGLKAVLAPEMLSAYKTGVTYQMWHALGLILIAILLQQTEGILLIWAGWFMFAGIILFSGSLYLLTILNAKWLGIITPFGGLAFLLAWILVVIFAWRQNFEQVQ